jgi:spore germination cell wall hydrolase CwlJ-like protein
MIGLECLAVAVFFESRNEPIEGQFAVAEVVMNRVESDRWPNGICDVVFQYKQFSFTHDGLSDRIESHIKNSIDWRAAIVARTVALEVYNRGDTSITSTHYHAASVRPYWSKKYDRDGRVGDHIFYTAPEGE